MADKSNDVPGENNVRDSEFPIHRFRDSIHDFFVYKSERNWVRLVRQLRAQNKRFKEVP